MMRHLPRIIAGAVILAALAVALAFGGIGLWNWAAGSLLGGALWLSVLRNRNEAVSGLGLLVLTGLALVGVYRQASALLLLTGLAAGIAGWDLVHFRNEMEATTERRDEDALIGNHLRSLAAVLVIGWGAGFLALMIHVQISLVWALVLGAAGVYALGRIIQAARR